MKTSVPALAISWRESTNRKIGLALLVAATFLSSHAPAVAQDRTDRATIMEQVISFRAMWLEQEAPFDACSAAAAVGGQSNFLGEVTDHLKRWLAYTESDCLVVAGIRPFTGGNIVHVRSMEVAGSTATVTLYVNVGYYTHSEIFSLEMKGAGDGARWAVREITTRPGLAI